jgi:hypothetical protein
MPNLTNLNDQSVVQELRILAKKGVPEGSGEDAIVVQVSH